MRSILRVDGVSQEQMQTLQGLAMKKFGKPNASLLVRHLIAEALAAEPESQIFEPSQQTVRKQIRLPENVVSALEEQADARLSDFGLYVQNLLIKQIGFPALQIDELEILRRSNYELSKIGTNFNQIARAFNTIIKNGGGGKPPEVAKKLAGARNEIKTHIKTVQDLLEKQNLVKAKRRGRASGEKSNTKKG